MGFPRQEYLSGLPFLSPGDLPGSGTEPTSLAFFISCITTSAVFKLYVSLLGHTLSKVLSFDYYYELMAFRRLNKVQWNIFIVTLPFIIVVVICGCPFWPLLWTSSRASLPLQEQRCWPVNASPASYLASFEWTEAHGYTCGWATGYIGCPDAAGQYLFKVTVHSHYSGLTLSSCLLF